MSNVITLRLEPTADRRELTVDRVEPMAKALVEAGVDLGDTDAVQRVLQRTWHPEQVRAGWAAAVVAARGMRAELRSARA